MKDLGNLLLGVVLMIVGAVIFLQNVTVDSFSLYRYNEVNVGAIVIILLAIAFVTMLVKTNIVTIGLFIVTILLFIVVMILSVNFKLKKMSALVLVLIIGLICVGLAMLIKGLLGIGKSKE